MNHQRLPAPATRRLLPCLAAFLFSLPAFADALTDQAKRLLASGQAGRAYELLIPHEAARAGEVEYDLLLGIAAIDSGRNTNGVFALERVLALEPNNSRARAEIARAYLAMGETQTARREFETVKDQPVPEEVKRTIDRFLSAIESVEAEGRTSIGGYVDYTWGRDSNVNSAVSSPSLAIPGVGTFTLNAAGVRQADDFNTVGAGLSLRSPLGGGWALVGAAGGSKRMNNRWDIFDIGNWDASAGVVKTRDKDVFTLLAQTGNVRIDNNAYREHWGFSAQWQHNYNQRTQATAFLQYTDIAFPNRAQLYNNAVTGASNVTRDATRHVLGVGFAHALRDYKTVFYGSAYVGGEKEKAAKVPELGFSLIGARIGGQYQFDERWSVFANLSYEERRHRGEDPTFRRTRRDGGTNVGVGVVFAPAKQWKVTPMYQFSRNDSNLATSDYKREIWSISVRRDF